MARLQAVPLFWKKCSVLPSCVPRGTGLGDRFREEAASRTFRLIFQKAWHSSEVKVPSIATIVRFSNHGAITWVLWLQPHRQGFWVTSLKACIRGSGDRRVHSSLQLASIVMGMDPISFSHHTHWSAFILVDCFLFPCLIIYLWQRSSRFSFPCRHLRAGWPWASHSPLRLWSRSTRRVNNTYSTGFFN